MEKLMFLAILALAMYSFLSLSHSATVERRKLNAELKSIVYAVSDIQMDVSAALRKIQETADSIDGAAGIVRKERQAAERITSGENVFPFVQPAGLTRVARARIKNRELEMEALRRAEALSKKTD